MLLEGVFGVLFDVDNIIIDSEILSFKTMRDILRESNLDLKESDFIRYFIGKMFGKEQKDFLLSLNPNLAELDMDNFIKERYKRMEEHYKIFGINLLDDVIEVLDLFKGIKISAVSAKTQKKLSLKLKAGKVEQYFPLEYRSVREEISIKNRYPKPHPGPYLHGCKLMNVSPGFCMAFEDTEQGVESAFRTGIACIVAIVNKWSKHGNFSKADYVFSNWREFLDNRKEVIDGYRL